MKNIKKYFCVAIAVILVLSAIACGSKFAGSAAYDNGFYATESAFSTNGSYNMKGDGYSDYYDYDVMLETDNYSQSDNNNSKSAEKVNDSARKLIKTYNLSLETESYDDLLNAINARISALGGYVESLQNYNGSKFSGYKVTRSATMTARIPASNADAFVAFVGDSANITRNTLSVEDVTLNYVDMESRKQTLEVEQARLLALLEKADKLEDILTIESRLTDVRYRLESMASQLRTYDNLVDYSTIYLQIEEVTKYTAPEPESFGERVAKSFENGITNLVDGFKEFTVDFVGALPGLVVFGIIVFVIVFVCVKITKKNKLKKAKKNAQLAAQRMEAMQNKTEENTVDGQ